MFTWMIWDQLLLNDDMIDWDELSLNDYMDNKDLHDDLVNVGTMEKGHMLELCLACMCVGVVVGVHDNGRE